MNCYKHQEQVAVAACSEGCGRALCRDCAELYDPPTCQACAAKLGRLPQKESMDQKSGIFGNVPKARNN